MDVTGREPSVPVMTSQRTRKQTAAAFSVFSNLFLVILKLLVGFATNSVSVLSEAAHSVMDLIASGIAYLSVRRADLPADRKHAYGHGKIENISGLLEALLIFLAAFLVIYEAAQRLLSPGAIHSLGLGVGVMGFSAAANLFISRFLMKTARDTDSMALKADAHHLLTDVYTSGAVMVGLLLIRLTGINLLDPLIALGVALLILRTAYGLTLESIGVLMDARLPDGEEELVASILTDHSAQALEFHNLRTRKAGSHRHIDVHLVVRKDTPVEQAHELCDHLEADIRAALPNSTFSIHIEPDSILTRREREEIEDGKGKDTSEQGNETPAG